MKYCLAATLLALVALAQLVSAGKLRSSENSQQLVQAEPEKKDDKKDAAPQASKEVTKKLQKEGSEKDAAKDEDEKKDANTKAAKEEGGAKTSEEENDSGENRGREAGADKNEGKHEAAKKGPKAWEPQYKPATWKDWFGGSHSDKSGQTSDAEQDSKGDSDAKEKDEVKVKERRDNETSDEMENNASTKKGEGKSSDKVGSGKAIDKDSDETKTDTNGGKTGDKSVDKEAEEDKGDKEQEEEQREDEEEDTLEKRRKQKQAKARAKAKESHDIPYESWGVFLPACRKELKDLVALNEHQYGPPQLKGVLEHECELDKQFSTVREHFFDRRKECKAFARQVAQARADERNGKPYPYDECCHRWWDEYMSNNPSHHGKALFWLYVFFSILAVVFIGATVMRHIT